MATNKTAPTGLKGAGLKHWKANVDRLVGNGVLTSDNLVLFEFYCHLLTDADELRKDIRKNGLIVKNPSGVRIANPASSLLLQVDKRLECIGRQLQLWGAQASRRRKFEGLAVFPGPESPKDGSRKRGG